MANEKLIKDDDILDAECLKLFSPSNKMTEKQFKKVLEYLNGCVLKKSLETSNEIQRLVILRYLQDASISEEDKRSSMGEENYKQWKLLVMETQNRIFNISKDRENNPNLKIEVNNNGGQSSTKVETDETEEIKMEEKKEEMEEQKEKNFLDKFPVKLALVFGGGVVIGTVGKTVYDAWSSKGGSIVTDTVESVSEFAEEFC